MNLLPHNWFYRYIYIYIYTYIYIYIYLSLYIYKYVVRLRRRDRSNYWLIDWFIKRNCPRFCCHWCHVPRSWTMCSTGPRRWQTDERWNLMNLDGLVTVCTPIFFHFLISGKKWSIFMYICIFAVMPVAVSAALHETSRSLGFSQLSLKSQLGSTGYGPRNRFGSWR